MTDISRQQKIVILDFGTQYAMLIARTIRQLGTYSEVVPFDTDIGEIQERDPIGVILSGGPKSVYAENAPNCDPGVFSLGVPVLGICYGMQLLAAMLEGEVKKGKAREYGHAVLEVTGDTPLLKGLPGSTNVWMSHGDEVSVPPAGFDVYGRTDAVPCAVIGDGTKKLFGVQFHPEVSHTDKGKTVFDNFLDMCGSEREWQVGSMLEASVQYVREKAPKGRIICGLSGGVDSSVTAKLLSDTFPERLTCIFIDNGLLRQDEAEQVEATFSDGEYDLRVLDARDTFLSRLRGISDPQKKREIIGHTFIDIFEKEASSISGAAYLAQGTLYPDVIESMPAHGGPTDCIKLHHNVGGLPPDIAERFTLIEPLRNLFKDEVRKLGSQLGLSDDIVWRHPFPGPGLAVRIIGEILPERLRMLREADAVFSAHLKESGLYRDIGQAFVVFLPVNTVGVMGDERSYENVVVIRSVDTIDYMTADWTRLPYDLLQKISGDIISKVKGINRVVYDITSKPPGTIEWE